MGQALLEQSNDETNTSTQAKASLPIKMNSARPLLHGLNVYRDHLRQTLQEALEKTYPLTVLLLGKRCFISIAQSYIRTVAPASYSSDLNDYGYDFPAFVSSQANLAVSVPYLADFMALELSYQSVYYARDDDIRVYYPEPKDYFLYLSKHPPDKAFVYLSNTLHLVRSSYPLLDIWEFCLQASEQNQVSVRSLDLKQSIDLEDFDATDGYAFIVHRQKKPKLSRAESACTIDASTVSKSGSNKSASQEVTAEKIEIETEVFVENIEADLVPLIQMLQEKRNQAGSSVSLAQLSTALDTDTQAEDYARQLGILFMRGFLGQGEMAT